MADAKPPAHPSYWRWLPDGSMWYAPSERTHDLAWKLIHMPERVTPGDMMLAAEIMGNWHELIRCTGDRRSYIVRELRQGPNTPPHASGVKGPTDAAT